jgi:hypothetical protein
MNIGIESHIHHDTTCWYCSTILEKKIMSLCVDNMKENMLAYKVNEDLYKHKFKVYAHAFLESIGMIPHYFIYSQRNVGSLSIAYLNPNHQSNNSTYVKDPKSSPTKLRGNTHYELHNQLLLEQYSTGT